MAQLTTTDLKEALTEVRKDLTAKIENSVEKLHTDLSTKIDSVRTDLTTKIDGVRTDLTAKIDGVRTGLSAKIDGSREELTESIRDLNTQFMQSQADQNSHLERLDDHVEEVGIKVNAIMEMLATRKEVRALIRELKAQGIKLEESRIFAD
jgi:uncharacterized protein YicC (UPF0701 family)